MIIGDESWASTSLIAADERHAGATRPAFTTRAGLRGPEKFFIWIHCNPLKSPDQAKEKQGNPSVFVWFYLVFLGFSLERVRSLVVLGQHGCLQSLTVTRSVRIIVEVFETTY
jgi:hypothetical protein